MDDYELHDHLNYIKGLVGDQYYESRDELDRDFKFEKTPFIKGAYGTITKGTIRVTGQPIVKKESNNVESIPSLINECELTMHCNHPGIQMLIGFYYSEELKECALITPYCEKKSLHNYMYTEKRKLLEIEKYIIIFGLALSCKYLHKIGISHRDLKPQNILIDCKTRPIITDLGISKLNKFDEMSTEIGTIMYMAPEMFSNRKYDKSIDVYAFALVINELFAQTRPYGEDNKSITIKEVIDKKEKGEFKIAKNMPDFLQKIVKKCLDPNPSKRMTFKDICKTLKSNIYKIKNYTKIAKYIDYIKIGKKQKRFFRIPKQILKIQNILQNPDTNDVIDFQQLNYNLELNDNKYIIPLLAFGPYGNGKSTLFRHLTGNQAFYSGKNDVTTTMGLMVDKLYSFDFIISQIFNLDYSDKFRELPIPKDTQILFIDSQGIGEGLYKRIKNQLDRIFSIFYSCSSACISIQLSSGDDKMDEVFQIIRGIQFSCLTKEYFLVRGNENFLNYQDSSFGGLDKFLKGFSDEYIQKKSSVMKNFNNNISIIPIYELFELEDYYKSIWFSFYRIFSQITKNNCFQNNNLSET